MDTAGCVCTGAIKGVNEQESARVKLAPVKEQQHILPEIKEIASRHGNQRSGTCFRRRENNRRHDRVQIASLVAHDKHSFMQINKSIKI